MCTGGADHPSTRAGSTIAWAKWSVLQCWFKERRLDLLACAVGCILSFCQCVMDRGLSPATVTVCAAAISSCQHGFGHPPIKRILERVRRQLPVMHASSPQRQLPLVLEALAKGLFEILECSSLKALLSKNALLLALTSSKRVFELTALLVHPWCLLLCGDRSKATLRKNSSFRSRVIQLDAFCHSPHAWENGGKGR